MIGYSTSFFVRRKILSRGSSIDIDDCTVVELTKHNAIPEDYTDSRYRNRKLNKNSRLFFTKSVYEKQYHDPLIVQSWLSVMSYSLGTRSI